MDGQGAAGTSYEQLRADLRRELSQQ